MTNATNIKCTRCGGRGRIDAFRHHAGGECFDCGGTGIVEGRVAAKQAAMAPSAELQAEASLYSALNMWLMDPEYIIDVIAKARALPKVRATAIILQTVGPKYLAELRRQAAAL